MNISNHQNLIGMHEIEKILLDNLIDRNIIFYGHCEDERNHKTFSTDVSIKNLFER